MTTRSSTSAVHRRISYANVMSTLVFVMAFGGGTAYATHLVVRSDDIGKGEVTAVAPNAVPGAGQTPTVGIHLAMVQSPPTTIVPATPETVQHASDPASTEAIARNIPPPPTTSPPPTTAPPPPSKPYTGIDALGAAGQVKDGTATPVYEQSVTLTAGVETTFETRNLSSGADPVLHLLTSGGVDFARNDDADSSTRAARLTVKPTVSGSYLLILHAYTPASAGTATIYRDGTALTGTVPVAGWRALVAGLRSGESLETVRRPGSAVTSQVMYIFDPDRQRIWQRVTGGGTAGNVRFAFQFLAGSRHVIFGARSGSGTLRVVRNDSGIPDHDPDRDNLGTELEDALNTCSRRSGVEAGFDCGVVSDARDSDGDGIRDDWEVLGRRDLSPHQPLPLWGADPRHKDIFVEVDFMRRCGDPASSDQRMPVDVARQMAAFYADQVGPAVSATRRAARAADLENPDGRPGIRLHLDTGVSGSAGETTYGDWGGHSVVAPVTDGNGNCMAGQSAANAWPSMARVRRGVFHYVLVYFGGGGQAAEWRAYAAFNADSALNSAHEFGHSLGLGHSGRAQAFFQDPNCKPNYPSLMNYAYYDHWQLTSDVGFSDGRDRPTLVNGALTERNAINPNDSWFANHLRTIFQYNVDGATGSVDWNRNGMIESLTVRAYANYAPGGAGCEWTKYNSVPLAGRSMRSPALIRFGGYAYVLYARASDGRLAYTRTSSPLICREAKEGPCAGATFDAEKTRPIDASQGVAAVRLQFGAVEQLLIVAAGADGALRETRLSLASGGVERWTAAVTRVPSGVASEPSLKRVSSSEAYLAFAGPDRRVRIGRFTTSHGWWPIGSAEAPPAFPTGPPPLLPALPAGASPGLGWVYTPSQPRSRALYGAFADDNGRLALYRLDKTTGYWTETTDLDTNPTYTGRPALVWAPTYTSDQTIGHLYLHYLTPAGVVRSMSTYTSGIGSTGVQRIGLDGPFINVWSNKKAAVESMQETTVGTNVRLVIAAQNGKLILYPNADGISDFALTNNNDWRVFRTSLCRTLMYPTSALGNTVDPNVPTPIQCEPAPSHT